MTTCRYIEATFGGSRIRFQLAPEDISELEASLESSAFHQLRVLISGHWTMWQLFLVLSAAIPPEASGLPDDSNERRRQKLDRHAARLLGPGKVVESPVVRDVLNGNPPARYAVLATSILEAALFGVDAEQAIFDENASEEAA